MIESVKTPEWDEFFLTDPPKNKKAFPGPRRGGRLNLYADNLIT